MTFAVNFLVVLVRRWYQESRVSTFEIQQITPDVRSSRSVGSAVREARWRGRFASPKVKKSDEYSQPVRNCAFRLLARPGY